MIQKQVFQLLHPLQNCSPSTVPILVNDPCTRLVTGARNLRLPRGPFPCLTLPPTFVLTTRSSHSASSIFLESIFSIERVSLPLTWITSSVSCKPNRFWISPSKIPLKLYGNTSGYCAGLRWLVGQLGACTLSPLCPNSVTVSVVDGDQSTLF